MAIFITGGARSGKSGFAEAYAMKLAERGIYVATSQNWGDEEMEARTALHQHTREQSGYDWQTIEEPYALADLLERLEQEGAGDERERPAVLVDCLTLWLTNWMLRLDEEDGGQGKSDTKLVAVIDRLVEVAAAYTGPLLLVTNEVGSGIVPAYPLGRRFRDEAGRMNRKLAARCEQALLVVAGIPLDLKAHAFRIGE